MEDEEDQNEKEQRRMFVDDSDGTENFNEVSDDDEYQENAQEAMDNLSDHTGTNYDYNDNSNESGDTDEKDKETSSDIMRDKEKNDDTATDCEEGGDKLITIRSNKGGEKLCFRGRMYTFHRKCTNFIRWRCNKHASELIKCKGAINTTLDKSSAVVVTDHNHVVDIEAVRKEISLDRMKAKARDGFAKPSQIFADEVQQLPNSTRARLPLEASVKRTLRNQRSREFPLEPSCLEDLLIEGDWTKTGGAENEHFLLMDNRNELNMVRERVIVFATNKFLQLLSDAASWFMDGNFDLAPPLFLQLYVLRVRVNGIFITVAYALLERKTESTYAFFIQTIIDKCAELDVFPDPQVVHVDFEKAMTNAIRRVLGDQVRILGCFYHLTQSTYRKVQDLNLTVLYKENEKFNRFCGMIDGLAFLPEEDVIAGMEYLEKVAPEEGKDLLTYFDETYVRGRSRRTRRSGCEETPSKIRRISPRFPIDMWNVHEATLNGDGRTNNSTEGWNNRFKNIVGMSHPTVWLLIEKMRKEIAVDTTKLLQSDLGAKKTKKKRSACEEREATLVNLCTEYAAGQRSLVKFLKSVSHQIRFRRI